MITSRFINSFYNLKPGHIHREGGDDLRQFGVIQWGMSPGINSRV